LTRPCWRPAVTLAPAAVFLVLLAGVALSVRFRLDTPLRWVRQFNRRLFNRLVAPLAGRCVSPFALLRHTGRRSGRVYETPVVALPAGRAFFIALTYGPQTDWCRNVRAAGGAMIVRNGVAYAVQVPQIVDAGTALPRLSPAVRLATRLLGIREFLMVAIIEGTAADEASPQPPGITKPLSFNTCWPAGERT
jgi:deazaflavin-dependent oxidoreductase (nitroreductase family)